MASFTTRRIDAGLYFTRRSFTRSLSTRLFCAASSGSAVLPNRGVRWTRIADRYALRVEPARVAASLELMQVLVCDRFEDHRFASVFLMCSSSIRRTSSAKAIPSRFASFSRAFFSGIVRVDVRSGVCHDPIIHRTTGAVALPPSTKGCPGLIPERRKAKTIWAVVLACGRSTWESWNG